MGERLGKILITGGAGFLGGFLGRALAQRGHAVHLVDNLARGQNDSFLTELLNLDGVELFERDIMEAGAFDDLSDDYTHIFHLAAIVGVQNVVERPYATLRNNVLLLERTIAFARRQASVERFLFASSSEVYAGGREEADIPIPTPEDIPLILPESARPRTSYMLSKIYGEAMIRHAGVPFTIVRPHNLYGPRMGTSHVVPQLMEKARLAKQGGRLEVFSVDHSRTFCFIDDAVEMILRAALMRSCHGQVLNVGNQSAELSIGKLAEMIIAVVGKELTIDPKPATPGSPKRRCPEMSRTVELTGYRARVPP